MSLGKEIGETSADILKEFDNNKDGGLDFGEFRNLCKQLFHAEEMEKNESKVQSIFEIFDINNDGLLKDGEWERYEIFLKIMNQFNFNEIFKKCKLTLFIISSK